MNMVRMHDGRDKGDGRGAPTGPETTAVLPFLMCGGDGTGLWPLSRKCMPKQFVSLVSGAPSTFRSALERIHQDTGFGPLTVITTDDGRHLVEEQMGPHGSRTDILLEPEGRDSCAAVAAAALKASDTAHESLVLVMTSDHVVRDDVTFRASCATAAALARDGHLVMFGSTPSRTLPGTCYAVPGEALGIDGATKVVRIVEDPGVDETRALVRDGALAYAGCLLFRADVVLSEMAKLAPDVLASVREALASARTNGRATHLDARAFARAPRLSFEHAVLARSKRVALLPVRFDWVDVGTWDALWETSSKDGEGNSVQGRTALLDTRGSLVRSEDGVLTAVVGLHDVVVVATRDAVLVTSKKRSRDVKDLVTLLKADARPETDEHLRTHRPWGWYQRVDAGDRFQVKRIMVKPQGRLSLQKHHHRAEHWVVVKGTAEVTVDGETRLVHENQSVQLPVGCVHRLSNPGKIPLELVEVQVGAYTGEDDIIRLDDDYGR